MTRELARLTSQPLERVEKDLKRDFYLAGPEAVSYGVIDEVLKPHDVSTSWCLFFFPAAPVVPVLHRALPQIYLALGSTVRLFTNQHNHHHPYRPGDQANAQPGDGQRGGGVRPLRRGAPADGEPRPHAGGSQR